MTARFIWGVSLLIAFGCQHQTKLEPEVTPRCEPLPAWLARLPAWQNSTLRITQLARFHDRHNEAVHVLRYDVVLSRESLVMAAQTTLGLPLYESILRGGCLTVSRHVSQLDQLPAAQAVADFVLVNWPIPALSVALKEAGYTLEVVDQQRRLFDPEGAPLVSVSEPPLASGNSVHIQHHHMPLEITIQDLQRRDDQR